MGFKILKKGGVLPKYETRDSAGADIRAIVNLVIEQGKRAIVSTGIALNIPEGYECQVRSRSGLAWKHGVTVLNSPGTIDSDYRGEIKIVVINLGQQEFHIKSGDRIAQLVFAPVARFEFEELDEIGESSRGSSGFGSTGVK